MTNVLAECCGARAQGRAFPEARINAAIQEAPAEARDVAVTFVGVIRKTKLYEQPVDGLRTAGTLLLWRMLALAVNAEADARRRGANEVSPADVTEANRRLFGVVSNGFARTDV